MKNYKDSYKVEVINVSHGRVCMVLPELRFKRVWEKQGIHRFIDFGILKEAIYETGVEALFRQGLLDIPELDVKIALGLEPEGATEPQEIIILTEAQCKRALTHMPMMDFKELVATLPREQILALTDYAIETELISFDKNDLLKELTGIDVMKAIELKRLDQQG